MYSAGIEPVTFAMAELGSNCSAIANMSPLAIDYKKLNFDVFSKNRTGDLRDGRAAF